MTFVPVDQDARERARREHGTSFVLEAGAGTGKTTLLVDRIEQIVRTGAARLDEIAAVTFTENAATTMKLRLRERLERARADLARPPEERRRAEAALEVLERAQVSTIHALCAAVLGERPLECGVPPGFRVADDAEMDILFAEAWDEWLTERLVAGDATLMGAVDSGIPLEADGWGERSSLRGLARTLVDQRDLRPLVAESRVDPTAWRRDLEAQAARARALLPQVRDGDALGANLGALVSFAEDAARLEGEALATYLRTLPVIRRNFGHKAHWSTPEALEEGRAVAAWTSQAAAAWKAASSAALHSRLVKSVLEVVARYEERKKEHGVLDFLDLLVKARDALKQSEAVRRYFNERFRFVIIDEFQDTDPLQVEVAELLTGGRPGALVVVGDAKQSIYRFRRAEVALFRRISTAAAARPGHGVLHLTQNFRSRAAILHFVNRAFASLITASDESGQPPYEAIAPPPGLSEDPSVIALRFEAPFADGEDLLRAEARALAAFLAGVAAGGHEVRDPQTGVDRPSRAGDVMVLARRLTQMRPLEEALESAGLRFTIEGGKSFFDRQEVHEVLAVLRALDDPSDRVSLVAALRSSFCGVSDRDIVAYALSGGSLWIEGSKERGARVAGGADLPGAETVAPALALLGTLHGLRTSLSVPALLERLYDETRILAALTGTRRGEAQVANLEKVVVLARKASDLGVLTVRGFVRLLQERIRTAREEPDLPATRPGDPDTVRILSIHKAKGLESPVVALYDTADDYRTGVDLVAQWAEGTIAVGFREGCQPPGWDVLSAREKVRAGAEARRLLYVACTRARDLLVVPAPPKDARVGAFWKDLIAQLPARSDADVRVVDAGDPPTISRDERGADLRELSEAGGGDAAGEQWDARRGELLEAAGHRPFVPASVTRAALRQAPAAVAIAAATGGRDFGSLVHRILEWVPLAEPERVRGMAEALAPSFGLDAASAARAATAAERALALPVMERARLATRVWRELPLWFPEGAELLEGVIDLVFEEDGALVLVDYKTDGIAAEQALAQAAHHAPQLQLYGRGLAQALGMPVRERLVLFTTLGQVVAV
ncbi:MAG TPA: UvrD-helicase domain-containing protein [Vicinamibacteria bacterium]|nr:UvrD-helicase domain-containing protein [Vicinamibacteria bacterium]